MLVAVLIDDLSGGAADVRSNPPQLQVLFSDDALMNSQDRQGERQQCEREPDKQIRGRSDRATTGGHGQVQGECRHDNGEQSALEALLYKRRQRAQIQQIQLGEGTGHLRQPQRVLHQADQESPGQPPEQCAADHGSDELIGHLVRAGHQQRYDHEQQKKGRGPHKPRGGACGRGPFAARTVRW